jgi:hypothetical protein
MPKKQGKLKKFFSKLAANLDKKIQEKAAKGGCCCRKDTGSKGSSCCK